jgi:hypothetical protein
MIKAQSDAGGGILKKIKAPVRVEIEFVAPKLN